MVQGFYCQRTIWFVGQFGDEVSCHKLLCLTVFLSPCTSAVFSLSRGLFCYTAEVCFHQEKLLLGYLFCDIC